MSRPRFRDIIAQAYNEHPNDYRMFKNRTRQLGKEYGLSPMLIIALIGLAIQLYQFWRSLQHKTAPAQPLPNEPTCPEEDCC